MKFNNPYWSVKTKLQLLEKWIIVHSIIYYEMNTNLVSDSTFDKNAQSLARGIKKHPLEFKKTRFAYCFKEFDGSTGFDLYNKLKKEDKIELKGIANYLVKKFGGGI